MAPHEEVIEVFDGRIKTRVLSAGDGDPVVYLHGAGGLFWDPFLDALAERYLVIAPEHPGSGESVGVEHIEDLWDLVLYYDELFDSIGGLDRIRLVGHSFGGMVAAEIAAHHRERIAKLALLCPIGLWRDDAPIPDISAIPPERIPALVFADPDGPIAAMMPRPDPTDPEQLYRAALTMASVNQFIWPIPDKGLRKRLYRITAPTLVVWGSEDRLVPPVYADEFARGIAGARVEMVGGAGHLPQLEQMDRTVGAVSAFLAS